MAAIKPWGRGLVVCAGMDLASRRRGAKKRGAEEENRTKPDWPKKEGLANGGKPRISAGSVRSRKIHAPKKETAPFPAVKVILWVSAEQIGHFGFAEFPEDVVEYAQPALFLKA